MTRLVPPRPAVAAPPTGSVVRAPIRAAACVRRRVPVSSGLLPFRPPRRFRPLASNSPTRRSTGLPRRPAASPRRCMRAMRCSRSAFPARCRIRPASCSRPPWRRWRRPSPATGRICRPRWSPRACCPTPSWKASSRPAKPMAAIWPDHGPWTRPSMPSPPRPMARRMPCGSAAAGFSATAPGPARAARSPASCSTIGSKAAARRCGCRNPTS